MDSKSTVLTNYTIGARISWFTLFSLSHFNEIKNIFEDEYGNYIEDEINNVCRHNKIYSDLLRNINNCDIESFFYDYINKEESIPQKYKQNSVENQDTEIYSDDDF